MTQWRNVTLADVADVQGGIQKQGKRRPVKNKYPFLRVANVARGRLLLDEVHEVELFEGELERYRLQRGDLLVVEGNGSPDQIGRAAVWDDSIPDCVHQNHLIRVRPRGELLPKYLGLAWNSPEVSARVRAVAASTSGLYTLSTAKLKSILIPFCPADEQRRIVDTLEDHFSQLDGAEKSINDASARSNRLRVASLAKLWHRAAGESELVRLKNVGAVITGSTPPLRTTGAFGGDVPFITPSDVGWGGLVSESQRTLSRIGAATARLVGPSAVIVVCIGTIGKAGWIDRVVATNQQINAINLDSSRVDAAYLAAAISAPQFQTQMRQRASTTTIALLNKSNFSDLHVPLPDLAQQRRLMEEVVLIQDARARIESSVLALRRRNDSLRRALLTAAFKGRLSKASTDGHSIEETAGV